jgi:hypothetical protein
MMGLWMHIFFILLIDYNLMNIIKPYNHDLKKSINALCCKFSWDEGYKAGFMSCIYHPTRDYFRYLYKVDNTLDNLLMYTIQNNLRK